MEYVTFCLLSKHSEKCIASSVLNAGISRFNHRLYKNCQTRSSKCLILVRGSSCLSRKQSSGNRTFSVFPYSFQSNNLPFWKHMLCLIASCPPKTWVSFFQRFRRNYRTHIRVQNKTAPYLIGASPGISLQLLQKPQCFLPCPTSTLEQ